VVTIGSSKEDDTRSGDNWQLKKKTTRLNTQNVRDIWVPLFLRVSLWESGPAW
jgi:hypothetical protein